MTHITAEDIIGFWFDESNKPYHFQKLDRFDQQITQQFSDIYYEAKSGQLEGWKETPRGALALIITLDQFPRNMFRDTAQAFATDEMAIGIAAEAIDRGFDDEITPEECAFLYMPYMHSEDLEDQERGITLYQNKNLKNNVSFAIVHRDIVVRFGRFPHRNQALKRESTPEEIEFLKQPNSRF